MVRLPRTQEVWEGSVRAVEVYEGYGPHGATAEGRRRDLTGSWDFVWHHGVDDDFHAALKLLYERGTFQVGGPSFRVPEFVDISWIALPQRSMRTEIDCHISRLNSRHVYNNACFYFHFAALIFLDFPLSLRMIVQIWKVRHNLRIATAFRIASFFTYDL